MKPTRPYFLRAIYDWIIESQCTPFLAVNADYPGVDVPLEFSEDGQITLNILPSAVSHFMMDDDAVSFNARFSGASRQLFVPMGAVLGLYAKESGEGMAFPEESFYEKLDGLGHVNDEPLIDNTNASALQSVTSTSKNNSSSIEAQFQTPGRK